MHNSKILIGKIPSELINYLLRRNISREKKIALINLANNRPNWLHHVDQKILTNTNFGFQIWCDRWDVIGQTIIATGQWEGLLSRTIMAALKHGDVAIDIGANIGYDTMIMSQAVGPTGSVLAFEPDLQNLTELIKNIANLDYNNVTVQSLALSDEIGMGKISVADQYNRGVSNLRPNENGPSQPIFATRLDRLLDKSISRISFVKMDIEGFEHKAIIGMGDLLDRVDYLAAEITPSFLQQCGTSAEKIFNHMQARGFSSYCAQPSSDSHWVASDHNFEIKTAHTSHFDVLFCRRPDSLLPLIKGSP